MAKNDLPSYILLPLSKETRRGWFFELPQHYEKMKCKPGLEIECKTVFVPQERK